MHASEYLVEIEAHDGASVKTLRVSTCGYVTGPGDTPANAIYDAQISDAGSFSASFFGAARTMGSAEVGYGDLVLANADGALDDWLDYAFDGRPIVVRRIEGRNAPFSSAVTIMTGTVQSLDSTSARTSLRLRIYDRRLVLDKPLQTSRYGGTTTSGGPTADGNADLKDKIKPLVFGRVFSVPATPVNPFDLIYQVHDGAVASIQAYDGGVALQAGADFPSVAALQAAAIVPGTFATAKALGLFRIGFSPAFDVTADVVEGASLAERYPASIASRIMARMGLGNADRDATSFAALDAAAPVECGIFLDSETNALDAIDKVLSSVGGAIVPDAFGVFEAGRVSVPASPVQTLTMHDVLADGGDQGGGSFGVIANPDTDGGVPVWRVVIKYRQVHQVQDRSRTAGVLTDEQRTFLAAEWREVVAEDATIKERYKLATEITLETAIANQADAQSEATRKLGLYGVNRFVLSLDAAIAEVAALTLGASVNAVLPLGSFAAGKTMLVIGRNDQRSSERVTLTLWG
ncbi:hypothetical protein [Rhizobium rhizoryzae]|uniref:Phage tail protein n=1 Tax=Rhizobium rhizoryzae TaxID=451876 RepID=A0A7W6PS81_9HYPH|nr:hypothetical protein [Rhizobium rhizoryzae]MBB4146020.1 hypothetical protein [Rhizobium rhizoryzae]